MLEKKIVETLILLPLLNHLFSDVMQAGGKLMTSLIFLYIFITITNELKSIILLIRDLTADLIHLLKNVFMEVQFIIRTTQLFLVNCDVTYS